MRYNRMLFGFEQKNLIDQAIEDCFPEYMLHILTKINKNNKPVFSVYQMRAIKQGYINGLKQDEIEFYSILDDKMNPIFNDNKMQVIRNSFQNGLSIEDVAQTFGKIKDNVSVFESIQMRPIASFVEHADKKQIQQLKDCIKEDLFFWQIKPFLEFNTSAENIRILKGFYQLGFTGLDVHNLLSSINDYDKLKDIKYLLQCANHLQIKTRSLLPEKDITVEKIKNKLTEEISDKYSIKCLESEATIYKCLSYKLPPEQIAYIADTKFNYKKRKAIAIGLLNGLSINEIENLSTYQEVNGAIYRIKNDRLTDVIHYAIKDKVGTDFDLNKIIDIKTDNLEEDIERDV